MASPTDQTSDPLRERLVMFRDDCRRAADIHVGLHIWLVVNPFDEYAIPDEIQRHTILFGEISACGLASMPTGMAVECAPKPHGFFNPDDSAAEHFQITAVGDPEAGERYRRLAASAWRLAASISGDSPIHERIRRTWNLVPAREPWTLATLLTFSLASDHLLGPVTMAGRRSWLSRNVITPFDREAREQAREHILQSANRLGDSRAWHPEPWRHFFSKLDPDPFTALADLADAILGATRPKNVSDPAFLLRRVAARVRELPGDDYWHTDRVLELGRLLVPVVEGGLFEDMGKSNFSQQARKIVDGTRDPGEAWLFFLGAQALRHLVSPPSVEVGVNEAEKIASMLEELGALASPTPVAANLPRPHEISGVEIQPSVVGIAQPATNPPTSTGVGSADATGDESLPPTDCRHAEDFSWVIWYGTKYEFSKGNQAETVRALWGSWEQSGYRSACGLGQATLQERAGSGDHRYRVNHVFRKHPAWGKMIKGTGKRGVFALFAPESPSTHTS
jgi:hypothetical protein